jgi:hypothetical protein
LLLKLDLDLIHDEFNQVLQGLNCFSRKDEIDS